MLNFLVDSRDATVLCIGRISRGKGPIYRERVKRRLLGFISMGYNNFLFCSWGYFDLTVAGCIGEIQAGLSCDNGRICPMAVFPSRDYDIKHTLPEDYFRFVIYRAELPAALPATATLCVAPLSALSATVPPPSAPVSAPPATGKSTVAPLASADATTPSPSVLLASKVYFTVTRALVLSASGESTALY